jgi:hypothetical protein
MHVCSILNLLAIFFLKEQHVSAHEHIINEAKRSDCAVAVSALQETGKNRTAYGHLFNEVKHLMRLREIVLRKI